MCYLIPIPQSLIHQEPLILPSTTSIKTINITPTRTFNSTYTLTHKKLIYFNDTQTTFNLFSANNIIRKL